METVLTIFAAMTVAWTLGMTDYRYVPALAAAGAATGILAVPHSMDSMGDWPGGLAATAVLGLSVLEGKRFAPVRLRTILRSAGLPAAIVAITGVAFGAAARDGLESGLLASHANAGDWANPSTYTPADIALLGFTTVAATAGMVLGAAQRAATSVVPGARRLQVAYTTVTMLAIAILTRVPVELRVALFVIAFVLGIALVTVIVRRIRAFATAWRQPGLDARTRSLALLELALPGAGMLASGRVWRALGRIAVSALIAGLFVLGGLVAIPLWLLHAVSGSTDVLRTTALRFNRRDNERPDDDWDPPATSSTTPDDWDALPGAPGAASDW